MNFRPAFLDLLGATIESVDTEQQTCTMSFKISEQLCHSVNVVQGGFVTAMLDAVSTHAVFMADQNVANVSSLEIKVSFLQATLAGTIIGVGKVERLGGKISFMSGKLFNEAGEVTATATTTAKLIRNV